MNYITLSPANTAFISLEGYFYDKTIFVYLSSVNNSIFPYVCAVNLFPNNSELYASFPTITGYPYYNYTIVNYNYLKIAVSDIPQPGIYDLIVGNNAGYTTLSIKGFLLSAT